MTGLDIQPMGPQPWSPPGPMQGPAAPLGPRYGDVWGPQSSPAPLPSAQPSQGATPAAAPGGLEGAGTALAVAGALTQAVGNFYAAKSAKLDAKSAALTFDFRSRMAMLEARAAEEQAQAIFQSSRRQLAAMAQQAAEDRGRAVAQTAARGGSLGVGSAAEVLAGKDYEAKLAAFTVSANATRAAADARMRATGARNQAIFDDVSARNAARSGQTVRPWLSVATSLLGSSATIIRAMPRDVQR